MMEAQNWLATSWMGMPAPIWIGFVILVLLILALDLGVFHARAHEPTLKESMALAAGCLLLGMAFSAAVWWLYYLGYAHSLDREIAASPSDVARAWTAWELYLTGWIIEVTLSFDNVFVMSLIFSYFAIPRIYQHRVLFYGIIGVIVLRAIMIGVGAALVHKFAWILFVFSAFLIYSGFKMLVMADDEPDLENNVVLKWIRRHVRVTNTIEGQRFVVYRVDENTGKQVRWFTPLFVALILIELADVVFAVDSVPAIFAITQDPFIVYTSNIFAILGLRALYFVLSAMVHRFHYLKYALALVLIYIGGKIFVQELVGKISPQISLLITATLLLGGILVSLWMTRRERQKSNT